MVKEIYQVTLWILLASSSLFAGQTREEIFNDIYENKVWTPEAEEGGSGEGSLLKTTVRYRRFLECFLCRLGIQSVVDVGCGDWSFSRHLNWDGISYIGYDIVASVIEKDQAKYTSSNIRFVHGDAIKLDLPSADLLICKDVLQHLTDEEIMAFMSQFSKFKYCLITNDVDKETLSSQNRQITTGECRTIHLTQAPFSIRGKGP